jgi:tetratricopeptide (TPR) repeat protein
MSFLDRLFGKRPQTSQPAIAPLTQLPVEEMRNDPNLVRVFDKFGRELFLTKEDWRKSVLPGTLQAQWNNPDQLYGIILSALNDGFRSDIVKAAQHLHAIEPQHVRGTCLWGIVLMEEGRLEEAEKVLRDFIAKHGEEGVVLTNLAKVHARRKQDAKAEEVLWHALELDPNQDNAFGWFTAIHRERGGEETALTAMRRIAALPGSWRSQLWLARAALQARNLDEALTWYREALARSGRPVSWELLRQISGDLGNVGHLPEILQLVEPHFDPANHGLDVGNNLIKAHLDLGQIDAARRILDQLYALHRPDWQEHLRFWDTEIAKSKVSLANVEPQPQFKIAMLIGQGPVWLKPASPAAELFPAKLVDGPVVCFLGGTAEIATNSQRIQQQLSDNPGRMSRALPLFLAEQVEFGSQARTQTLVPWITEPTGGFVLSAVAWSDEDAAHHSRQGDLKSDYVVISHLKTQSEPWTAELRLVHSINGKCLGRFSECFPSGEPTNAVHNLSRQLSDLLHRSAEVEPQLMPVFYAVPAGAHIPLYLLRLEQLLAIRCAAMKGVASGFLHGEREIVEGNIYQCLEVPASVSTRILLAETLLAMKRVRPDILLEFRDRLTLLQREYPLAAPAQGVLERLFNEALTP